MTARVYSNVKTIPAKELSEKLESQVMKLGLPHGMMRPTLRDCLVEDSYYRGYVSVIYKKRTVVAWSLLFISKWTEDVPRGHFFVKPGHRRKGLGTRLAKRMAKNSQEYFCQDFYYYEHDKRSCKFFNKMRDKQVAVSKDYQAYTTWCYF